MRYRLSVALAGGAVVLAMAALHGCDKADLTAPSDGTMTLSANPTAVTIDSNAGQHSGKTSIIARVFGKDGLPVQNVAVLFTISAGSGTLASAGAPGSPATPIKTDASGMAQDILTIMDTGPAETEVTASSSALSQKVTVKRVLTTANQPPTAVANAVPCRRSNPSNPLEVCKGYTGETIAFDGTSSTDPDGTITMYRWTISSDNPDPGKDNPRIVEQPGAFSISDSYENEQNLIVTLEVTDDPNAAAIKAAGGQVPYDSSTEPMQYSVVCNNPLPTADAGADQTAYIPVTGTFVQVFLDATNSHDEQGIYRYSWDCGSGVLPQQTDVPGQVYCRYTAVDTYVARVTVWDWGTNHQIDPNTGEPFCVQSATDETTVTVKKATQ